MRKKLPGFFLKTFLVLFAISAFFIIFLLTWTQVDYKSAAFANFFATAAGVMASASIAIYVMNRTSIDTKNENERTRRIEIAKHVIEMTAQFCSTAKKLFDISLQIQRYKNEKQTNTDYGQYESSISNLSIQFDKVSDNLEIILFEYDILRMCYPRLNDNFSFLEEIRNDATLNTQLTQKDFYIRLTNLRKDAAKTVQSFISDI